ncbi:uncharacterized protein [Euphorbia lathyris]|uniref:uncharacterized protein isoform X2 n=1 Tax=Euphorbia lathyris TaxID=212925 RepID=UPI0033137C08
MNTFASASFGKNSQSRGKSQGWAAVDLKNRQKKPQFVDNDAFPPLQTNSTTSLLPLPGRSFSSVVQSSAEFADCNKRTPLSNSSLIDVTERDIRDFALAKLQQLHSWADQGLIEDVMATVNNDTDKATALLTEMVSSDDSEVKLETKEMNISDCYDFQCRKGEKASDFAADIADLSSTLEDALEFAHKELMDIHTAHEQMLPDSESATANMKLILGHLKSLPVEPEWEENDVYLSHRRNALKMMRLASRHSRAATNAFIRGDHFNAQQQSLKARKEWLDAEILNSEAAKEILSLRNSEDNPWKLDLHGLHAAEAVQALQEHLQKIETRLPTNKQLASSAVKTKDGIVFPFGSINMENTDINSTRFRRRPASLQVITGVGNHSRGEASLPAAVRNFLIEYRYKFDETRPGLITVYPKFHHRG